MNKDISFVLKEWRYEPDNTIRIVRAENGRKLIQVRLPLGIEQHELEGRPDGLKPFGRESVLNEFEERIKESTSTDSGALSYKIDHDDFMMIQNEGFLFYYRYLLLFEIGDYKRCAADTAHNLRFCEILEQYCVDEDDKNEVLQYRPYIMRINAISRSLTSLYHDQDKKKALDILDEAVIIIQNLPVLDAPAFLLEKTRSIKQILSISKQIKIYKENPVAKFENELKKAIIEENYELAAKLRDKISEIVTPDMD